MVDLITALRRRFNLHSDVLYSLKPYLRERKIRKGDTFLDFGQLPQYYGFISQGAFVYIQPTDSEDRVIDYAVEGAWITHLAAMVSAVPSDLDIVAVEDATIWQISRSDLLSVAARCPIVYKPINAYLEETFVRLSVHERRLVTMDATQRYLDILTHQPEVFTRLSVAQVASYMGITPQSLSRIRRQVSTAGN